MTSLATKYWHLFLAQGSAPALAMDSCSARISCSIDLVREETRYRHWYCRYGNGNWRSGLSGYCTAATTEDWLWVDSQGVGARHGWNDGF